MPLRRNGYFDPRELEALPGIPSAQRLNDGPVAVIECAEEIPCNPCEEACRQGAIKIGESITDLPKLDAQLCHGCGLCIPACPGQAIFVVDMTYSDAEATIQLPYEFFPYPKPGDVVDGLNRAGRKICDAQVLKVINTKRCDKTAVVTVVIPKKYGMDVRNIQIRNDEEL